VATAFYTGMRKGEILNLSWDRIDLKKRIISLEPEDTKENRAKKIRIAKPLKDILEKLPVLLHGSKGKKPLFLYKGKQISDIREGLKRASRDAKIPYGRNAKDGFTLHDLRHGFATYMRKAGIARNVIMVIMGHSANDMNYRYDAVDETDLINAIDKLEVFLESVDHFVDQVEKN
jgi:integrase